MIVSANSPDHAPGTEKIDCVRIVGGQYNVDNKSGLMESEQQRRRQNDITDSGSEMDLNLIRQCLLTYFVSRLSIVRNREDLGVWSAAAFVPLVIFMPAPHCARISSH